MFQISAIIDKTMNEELRGLSETYRNENRD